LPVVAVLVVVLVRLGLAHAVVGQLAGDATQLDLQLSGHLMGASTTDNS